MSHHDSIFRCAPSLIRTYGSRTFHGIGEPLRLHAPIRLWYDLKRKHWLAETYEATGRGPRVSDALRSLADAVEASGESVVVRPPDRDEVPDA